MPRMVWRSGTGIRCTEYTDLLTETLTVGSTMSPVSCTLLLIHWSELEGTVQQ